MPTLYELLYLLGGHLTEAELKPIRERVEKLLAEHDISISSNDLLGKIKLAYPIREHRYGQYILIRFTGEPESLASLDAKLKLDQDVVRHIVVHADESALSAADISFTERREVKERIEKPVPTPAPRVAPVKSDLSAEDLDKKLDEILTEEVK